VCAGTFRQRHRNVPDRVRPRGGHSGGQRHIQHIGRFGVRGTRGQESHQFGKVATASGQWRVLGVNHRAGHHRGRRRGHVVRGTVSAVYVLWVLLTDVHARKAEDSRQKVEK